MVGHTMISLNKRVSVNRNDVYTKNKPWEHNILNRKADFDTSSMLKICHRKAIA